MNNILNYIKVNDSISTAGQPTIEQFNTVAENGFDVVINLALHTTNSALNNEDYIVSENGMSYFHIPVSWEQPEEERLELFLSLLEVLQKAKKKIFIHCTKNYRVSIFMHKYKERVLKEEDVKFVAPEDYCPNEIWKNFLES